MKGPVNSHRWFLSFLFGVIVFAVLRGALHAESKPKIKAVVFDAFVIFDPRPIGALAEKLFPGKGADLVSAWRTRQFEYTWLRTLSGQYEDFWKVTEDALVYAAKLQKLDLIPSKKDQLMVVYQGLKPWPDVVENLRLLKKSGIRVAFLTNFTPEMLESDIRSSNLTGLFDFTLSTDQVKVYKPGPRAYQMGVDAFGLKKEEILFVAFAGWDAAGAQAFGYPTFWVNRLQLPKEELGVDPKGEGTGLADVIDLLGAQRSEP